MGTASVILKGRQQGAQSRQAPQEDSIPGH